MTDVLKGKGSFVMTNIKNKHFAILQCVDGCCYLMVQKWEDDEDDEYTFTMLNSNCDYNFNGIWSRIKNAFRILFGKPVHHGELIINQGDFYQFVSCLNNMIGEKQHDS